MQGNQIEDRTTERYETYGAAAPVVEHPTEQAPPTPPEPASAPTASETKATAQDMGGLTPLPGPSATWSRGARDWLRRPWTYVVVSLLLLVVLGASIGGGIIGARLAPAQSATTSSQSGISSSATDVPQAVERVSQSVQPSIVQVRSAGSTRAYGSGVILSKDGYVATNDHVVNGFRSYTVMLSNGQSLAAQLIGEDPQNDLAVLKVTANDLHPVTFADSRTVKVGQFVIMLGSPANLPNTTTFGVVSALNRTIYESEGSPSEREYTDLIQLDMTLNPGSSGGALIDLQGRLVGMPNLRAESTAAGVQIEGIGFAIPANKVKAVTAQLIQAWIAGGSRHGAAAPIG